MRYHHSLRYRIILTFVISGVILGPVLTLALLSLTYHLEEHAVEELLIQRLQSVMAAPDDYPLYTLPVAPNVHILGEAPLKTVPTELLTLPDGAREYKVDQSTWFVAIGSAEGKRYIVFADITMLEDREEISFYVVGSATLLAVYLALWLGYFLSQRLLAPLTQLADTVSLLDQDEQQQLLAPDFVDDEVGRLAQALDHYRQRMWEAIERERAFSADASHELRNPLAVIQSAAELIESDPSASALTRRAAQRIRAAAVNMANTVTALLLLVRDPAITADTESVDLAECLEPIISRAREQSDPARVRLQWHRRATPILQGSHVAMQTIVDNLIHNALQYTRTGRIDVVLDADRLLVTDTGIGIPTEEIPFITERGQRGSNALGTGSGLGLALVKRLCEHFNWQLTLKSSEGNGTQAEWRFDFTNR